MDEDYPYWAGRSYQPSSPRASSAQMSADAEAGRPAGCMLGQAAEAGSAPGQGMLLESAPMTNHPAQSPPEFHPSPHLSSPLSPLPSVNQALHDGPGHGVLHSTHGHANEQQGQGRQQQPPSDPRLKPERLESVTEPHTMSHHDSQYVSWLRQNTQPPHASSAASAPGRFDSAPQGISHPSSQHVSGQRRQQPHEFLRSLGATQESPGDRQDPLVQSRQQGQPSLQPLGSFSASQGNAQRPHGSIQHPQGSGQHPQGDDRPLMSHCSLQARESCTPFEADSQVPTFGMLRASPISAQPQSVRMKLSYKWGTNSCVSGLLDLVAYRWSTNRMGKLWQSKGQTVPCACI